MFEEFPEENAVLHGVERFAHIHEACEHVISISPEVWYRLCRQPGAHRSWYVWLITELQIIEEKVLLKHFDDY